MECSVTVPLPRRGASAFTRQSQEPTALTGTISPRADGRPLGTCGWPWAHTLRTVTCWCWRWLVWPLREVAESLVWWGQWGPVSPHLPDRKADGIFSKSGKSVLVVHKQQSQTSQATDSGVQKHCFPFL